jgi:histidyl-tRNA synthetase
MKAAGKSGARFSIVIGDDELASDLATLKNMETGDGTSIKISTLPEKLRDYFPETIGDR